MDDVIRDTGGGGHWLKPLFITDDDGLNYRLPIYELISGGSGRGPFGKLLDGRGDKQTPRRLLSAAKMVAQIGAEQALSMGRLKHLSGDVYEIKGRGLTARAFCVLAGNGERILVVVRIENTKGGNQGCYGRFISLVSSDVDVIKELAARL